MCSHFIDGELEKAKQKPSAPASMCETEIVNDKRHERVQTSSEGAATKQRFTHKHAHTNVRVISEYQVYLHTASYRDKKSESTKMMLDARNLVLKMWDAHQVNVQRRLP